MKAVAARQKITLPADLSVDAEVDLGPDGFAEIIGEALGRIKPVLDRRSEVANFDGRANYSARPATFAFLR